LAGDGVGLTLAFFNKFFMLFSKLITDEKNMETVTSVKTSTITYTKLMVATFALLAANVAVLAVTPAKIIPMSGCVKYKVASCTTALHGIYIRRSSFSGAPVFLDNRCRTKSPREKSNYYSCESVKSYKVCSRSCRVSCINTDEDNPSGYDYSVAGTSTVIGGISVADVCKNFFDLVEASCNTAGTDINTTTHRCLPYGCYHGKCLTSYPPEHRRCRDSDGGANLYYKGEAVNYEMGFGSHFDLEPPRVDWCAGDRAVYEQYCLVGTTTLAHSSDIEAMLFESAGSYSGPSIYG